MNTHEILTKAYHLLDDKWRWTQGRLARDSKGVGVAYSSDEAVCFCAYGALHKASIGQSNSEKWDAFDALELATTDMYGELVAITNDELGYRQIRAAFRRAIKETG